MNTVGLVGRLTKDIELKYTKSGKAVGSFMLAVNSRKKDEQGNYTADFISCVVWDKAAEALANYSQKGSQVGLSGHINTRNYEDKDGKRVYVTEVVADSIDLPPRNQQPQQQADPFNNNQQQAQQGSFNPFNGDGGVDIDPDNFPF